MSTSSQLDPQKQKKAITEISRRMLSGWRMTDRICPICSTVLVSDKVSDKFYCCGCEMWAVVEKKTPDNASSTKSTPSAASTTASQLTQAKPKYAQVDEATLEEFKAADAAEADQHEKNRQTLAKLSAKLQNDLVNVTERNMRAAEYKAATSGVPKTSAQSGDFARVDENLDHEDEDEDTDDNLSNRFAGIRANFIEGVLEQMQKNNPNTDAQPLATQEDITRRLQEAQENERKAAEEFLARETTAKQAPKNNAQASSSYSKEENDDDIDMSKFFDTQYLTEDGRVIRAADMTPEQRRKEQELLDRRREEDRRLNCMAEAVRQGATMLATHCPQCGVPQVKRRGAKTAICAPCEELGPPASSPEAVSTVTSKSTAAGSSMPTSRQPVHASAVTQRPQKPNQRDVTEEEEEEEEAASEEEQTSGRKSDALQQMRSKLKALLESEKSKINRGSSSHSYDADDNELPTEDDAYLNGDDHFETGSEASLTMSETRRLLDSDDFKRQIEERDRKRAKLTSYLSTHIMMAEYCPDCLVPLLKPQAKTIETFLRETWNKASEDVKAQYFDFEDFESVMHDEYASECFCAVCGAKWTFTESGTAGVALVPKAPGNLSFDSYASRSQASPKVNPTLQSSGSSANAPTTSSASAVPEYVSLDELRARHAAVVADVAQKSTSFAQTTTESNMSQLVPSESQQLSSGHAARTPQSHGLFEPLTSQSLTEQQLQHDSFSQDYLQSSSLVDSTMKPSHVGSKASPSLLRITREAKSSIESSLDALRMSLDCVTQRLNLVVARENAITNDALLSQETVKSNDNILQVGWLANQTSQILASLSEAVRMQSNQP